MLGKLLAIALGLAVAACASIGPGTVSHDRIDYATSIGDSWKAQTLLNIVKLRYVDMPIFLEVAQVIAGYQVQARLRAVSRQGISIRASSGRSRRSVRLQRRGPTSIGRP